MATDPIDADWKDTMFRRYAGEFARILDARPVSPDLAPTLAADGKGGSRRFAVLDLGCGTGRLLPALSRIASVAVGLDYSPEMLAIAAEKTHALPNVVLLRADVRALRDTFTAGQFDAVMRAYTSLGYFSRAVESDILRQCAIIVRPGGRLVIDCFNKDWFVDHGSIERTTSLDGFTLEERYEWDSAAAAVSCLWRYLQPHESPIEIPFSLEGYGVDDLQSLLGESGWRLVWYIDDLTSGRVIADPGHRERIVVVAARA